VTQRTVILGLGNSILRDDAVGLLVAQRAEVLLDGAAGIDVALNERGGMDVLDVIGGYDRAILVDAIKTDQVEPGTLVLVPPDQLPPTRRLSGLHDLDLPAAIELADRLGMARPREMVILAVEIADDMEFAQDCTPRVEAAVDKAAQVVVAMARRETIPEGIDLYELHTTQEHDDV